MKNVLIDINTRKVVGYDRQPLPFEEVIQIYNDCDPSIMIKIENGNTQKVNDDNDPLFYDNIVVDKEGKITSHDEVTYDKIPIAFEEREIELKIVNDAGGIDVISKMAKQPTKYAHLNPVIVPAFRHVNYKLSENPFVFTEEDVIKMKKEYLNNNKLTRLVYFDENLKEETFSTGLSSHNADIGSGFVSLNPLGQLRTIKIPLGKPSKRIEIYAETEDGISIEVGPSTNKFTPVANNLVVFDTPVSEIYVLFKNNTEVKRKIHAFGILI